MSVGLFARYEKYLPSTAPSARITLGEGSTPLVPAPHLSKRVEAEVFLKLEGCNPTGSFKDRGMFLAVAKALEAKSEAVVCASTGNTSASAAAFAAKAGLRCYVLVPDGSVAMGKLAQATAFGARVLAIQGNFDQALELVQKLGEREPITVVNSVNPFRIEGQKTASFEVCEALGDAPDLHFLPVGNAGNITAYWKGYREAVSNRMATRTPKMMGYQAAGAAPIVLGAKVDAPKTIATAIKIGNPASWKGALAARDESGGLIGMCTDEKILEAYDLLAKREGVFCEPASSASVAGLLQAHQQGRVPKGARIACTLTGNGLKDPETAISRAPAPARVAADYDALLAAIG